MKKGSMKNKALSVALATSLIATSVQPFQVFAEKGEVSPKAVNSFDSNYDNQNAYNGNDLGCTYTKEKTTFKVWSPLATSVVLCRYATGSDGEAGAKSLGTIEMKKGDKGVWSCSVEGEDAVNTYYTYKVTANGKTNEAVDIYAKAVGVNGDRAMVVDLDSTDPDNWDTNYQREKVALSDISVWEIHVRDFSIDVSSGVSEKNRGKYTAFTEQGTTINGEGKVSTCVDYLKKLGVTHVQIMPMYDYASVDETKVTTSLGSNYNWGYDPENYNAPEGSYSTNPYDGNVRIKELKEMIQALHDANIKVIMDVVYNHTYDTADSNFNKIMPDYYYKINCDEKTKTKTYNNQSGCGNATRTEAAMYNKFMRESLQYWAQEYNLDGFRFDLMGIHDYNTMNQIRTDMDEKFGKDKIVLYGEGWTGDGSYYSNSAHKANEAQLVDGIGFFNDQIRDAVKGEHKFDGTIGLVQHNYTTGADLEPGEKWPNNVFGGIMGSVGKTDGKWGMWRPWWSKSSNDVVAYCSAHDNLTLWDKLTEGFGKQFDSTDDKLLRMNKMAGAVVLLSRGGYFMQAGEEFARTKYGDDNSYKSPDATNKIDWNRVSKYSNVQKYYEGMLSIRQVFSGLRTVWERSDDNCDNWHPKNCNMEWIATDATGVSAFTLSNNKAGEWNQLGAIINNGTSETTVKLGSGKWVVIADGNTAGLTKIAEYDGSAVKAAGKSVVVAVPKDTFDANPDVYKLAHKNQEVAAQISISVDATSINAAPGEKVTFTATAKASDGKAVKLSATGLPEGAEFDASTGVFTWDKAVKGEYTITIKADNGSATASKTVTIKVTAASEALASLVAEIEAAKLSDKDYTEKTWSALQSALTAAKNVCAKEAATAEECASAKNALEQAYKNVVAEKTAKEELKTYVVKAKTAIASASDSNDKALVEDAKAVLEEADKLLAGAATEKAFYAAKSNLEDSVNSLAVGAGKAGLKVSTSFAAPHAYAWTGSGTSAKKLLGEWPGTALTEKDSDGNYVIDIDTDEKYNVIINDGVVSGGEQTQDIEGVSGVVTISVPATGTNNDKNVIHTATYECKPAGTTVPEIFKTSLQAAIKTAKAYNSENYTAESYEVLEKAVKAAEAVEANAKATQLEINQVARAVRAAYVALVAVNDSVVEPTPVVPTPTPSDIEETPDPEETPQVTVTPGPKETPEVTEPSASSTPSGTPGVTDPNASALPTQLPDVLEPTQVPSASGGGIVSELTISSISISPSKSQIVNKAVKVSVKAANVVGECQYKFEVLKGEGTVMVSAYTSKSTFTFTPSKAGTYKIKAYVKDDNNVEKTKTKSFVIVSKKLKVSSLKSSKKTIKKGKKITFTAKISGGKKSYKYNYTVTGKKYKKSSGTTSKSKWTWKTTKVGTFKVKLTVTDSTGTTATKTISKIKVTK